MRRTILCSPPAARLFGQANAGAYLGISERHFENQWRAGKMPQPIRLGRRLLWDKVILDDWVDAVTGAFIELNDFGD